MVDHIVGEQGDLDKPTATAARASAEKWLRPHGGLSGETGDFYFGGSGDFKSGVDRS
jgi:hypothetical protein